MMTENDPMSSSELSDVAWDLVEHCRAALNPAELNTAFTHLGVGDYSEAMTLALRSLGRNGGPPLPAELVSRLIHVQQTYHVDHGFVDLLAAAPRAG